MYLYDDNKIKEAIHFLKEGKTILYPTDTIWGLGCDATNENACQRINMIKGRDNDKSFVLLVDSFLMIEKYIPEFHSVCYDLVDFAENPLTIVYPKANGLAKSVLAENGSVGIRITKDPICKKLIQGLKRPIVSTSANLSGKNHPTEFSMIDQGILTSVDFILEERTKEKLISPSQIIQIGLNGEVKIIRK